MTPVRSRSPDRARSERIRAHELPASAREIVAEYEAVGGERDRYLWRWLDHLFPEFTLSCVPSEHEDRVREAKFLASVFVVFLDDLAEARRDHVTFEEASKLAVASQSPDYDRAGVDVDGLSFAESVWSELRALLEAAPRWPEFADLFRFDLKQTLSAIEYSAVANRNVELYNVAESWLYGPPNMMLFTYLNLDLLYSPSFDRADLASLRRVALKVREVVRIGNWVTTWERELAEGDFSSGVLVAAMERGVVSRGELAELRERPSTTDRERIVDAVAASGIEDSLLDRADRIAAEVEAVEPALASVDLDAFLDGIGYVLECQLASRGLK